MIKHFFILLLALALATPAFAGEKLGVYVKAVEKAEGTFDQTVKAVEAGLSAAGFDVLASYGAGVYVSCGLRAHVIVANNNDYASKLMAGGPMSAFALPLRVGVYEDASGINVAFVNPSSLNRTVMGDEIENELSAATATAINNAITSSIKGAAVGAQIGQLRDRGYVGGMGGGKFLDKIATFHEGGEYGNVVASVTESAQANDKDWKLVYSMEPAAGVTLMGLTKPETEAKAFAIAGDRRKSKEEPCPGLDHAASFPIEVVIYSNGGKASVVSMDEMYRMKVYFEDAGNWAFMKNMTMPGNIQDELEEVVTSGLKKK